MKINIQNNYNLYKKRVAEAGVNKPQQSTASFEDKVDLNSISKGSTKVPDKQMLVMKSSVQSYVAAPADTQHLESLKSSIQNGTYRIETNDLVNALMDDNL
ncbi:MAG: flagellar biosynthesis anti-sigma factor FlgM [Oscillospiraceae bacterium]|jgi:anti-sigma28 factor (negative regulator of flagellin synthesis)|nr:flagellar biosynthesis anti-sigma factor FlgM [Oscillospiraceae bacterium]